MSALTWILIVVIALHVLVPLGGAFAVAFPNPLTAKRRFYTPREFGLSPREITLGDGAHAWLFDTAEADETVLICHGRSHTRGWMLPLVAALRAHYNVLVFDFLSHGQNPYGTTTIGGREASTVGHALAWLREDGHQHVYVYGVSMGGVAALMHLGEQRHDHVVGLVTDGSFDDLERLLDAQACRLWIPPYLARAGRWIASRVARFDPRDVRPVARVRSLGIPYQPIHGVHDRFVRPDNAEYLALAAGVPVRYYDGAHDEPYNPAMHAEVLRSFGGFRDAVDRGEEARLTSELA